MNLSDLARHANAGRIDALELISLEGGIYILDIYLQGQRHALVDERGSVCHLRSVEHARDLLRDMPEVPFYLLHASAHEEMCGLPATAGEPLRVPLSMRSAW